MSEAADFEAVCKVAAILLRKEIVFSWLCVRYPIVVVDEFQDCKGDRLKIVQAIESRCHVIAAADEFQDLQPNGPNAAVAWLHASEGKKNVLSGNRRTKQAVLLQAAGNLRLSQDCGIALGNTLMSGRNANAAAGGVARTLCWKQCKDVVILTPTRPENSRFVQDVVERLTSKPIQPKGITKPVGPFRVVWESNSIEEKSQIVSTLATMAEGTTLQEIQDRTAGGTGALGDLCEWAERKIPYEGSDAIFHCGDFGSGRPDSSIQARLPSIRTSWHHTGDDDQPG